MEIKTLKLNTKTPKLTEAILKDLKASENLGLNKCIQCGMCTSVCPAARHTDYDPRIISKRVLDEDEALINDDIIWDCFYCYTCHSICPVNNSVCEINQILRQQTIEKGNLKQIASFLTYGESFLELGIGSIPSEFFNDLIKIIGDEYLDLKVNMEEIREELKLGKLSLPDKDMNDVKNILKKTGFTGRLEKIEAYKKGTETEVRNHKKGKKQEDKNPKNVIKINLRP